MCDDSGGGYTLPAYAVRLNSSAGSTTGWTTRPGRGRGCDCRALRQRRRELDRAAANGAPSAEANFRRRSVRYTRISCRLANASKSSSCVQTGTPRATAVAAIHVSWILGRAPRVTACRSSDPIRDRARRATRDPRAPRSRSVSPRPQAPTPGEDRGGRYRPQGAVDGQRQSLARLRPPYNLSCVIAQLPHRHFPTRHCYNAALLDRVDRSVVADSDAPPPG